MKKNVVIGISAGIACYKILDLVKELKDFNIDVIMTKNSLNLISKTEFKKIGCNVYSGLFNKNFDYKDYLKNNKRIKHISLADKADIILIAPATANIIGKIANGVADDLLTAIVMATKAPVLICPSMNCNMYSNPIVQGNIKKLKSLGYCFIEPEYGVLACGYKGIGRLADVKKIKGEILKLLNKKNQLKGKKILVTAGATVEEIDPVRVITNKSSGKMGIYLAEEAAKRGASVTLLKGKTELTTNHPIKTIEFSSAKDLFNILKNEIKKNDTIIHAAAVSDFTTKRKTNKIKSDNNKALILKLEKSKKIIDNIKKMNKKIFLIGFKAEYNVSKKELIDGAYKKLKEADCDLIVANDVKKNPFGSEKSEVFVVDKNKKVKRLKLNDKMVIASQIFDVIVRYPLNGSK